MTKKKPNKPVPGDESNERMSMPSAAHTPWKLAAYGRVIRGDEDTSEDQVAYATLSGADARRFAACWNACDGMTTEEINSLSNLGMPSAARDAALPAMNSPKVDAKQAAMNAGLCGAESVTQLCLNCCDANRPCPYSEVVPAPVQQAATSEAIQAALKRAADVIELFDDATMAQADYMLDAGECGGIIRALADSQDYAAPAQPAGLSEQDKLDAALGALDHPLLRQLLGDIEDSNTPEATRLWSLVSAWAEVRDAAILAAKEAP